MVTCTGRSAKNTMGPGDPTSASSGEAKHISSFAPPGAKSHVGEKSAIATAAPPPPKSAGDEVPGGDRVGGTRPPPASG